MQDVFTLDIEGKIKKWDEGIPLGNGTTGALLFGSSDELILSLDRGDVWDRSASPEKTNGFSYDNLLKLHQKGDYKTIERIFDKPYSNPTPTKLPMGKIVLNIGKSKKAKFSLDIKRAEAVCRFDEISFRTYIHAVSGIGFVKTDFEDLNVTLKNPQFGKKSKFKDWFFEKFHTKAVSQKLKSIRYPAPVRYNIKEDNIEYLSFIQPLNDGNCYGVGLACKRGLQTEITYYSAYGIEVSSVNEELREKTVDALKTGYDGSIAEHLKWWKDYFDKSSVSLPDKYIENRYNLGNYLLGSASRKGGYPMPLQGLWTECGDKFLPPWKGDYHNDLNTQMTYFSYLKANRLEQGECFIDYLLSLTQRAREFAQKFFKAKGLCLPGVMDIDGYALGGWAMYSLSPTNQLWLCQIIERHYTYTGDMDFLINKAYPYVSESAEFICSLLEKDSDGYYVLPISSSPEIHDNTAAAFLRPNSNYDLALIIYILKTTIRFCKILGKDYGKWQNYLDGMQKFSLNKDGVLMLSKDEILNESHRHMSHCMSIYPLRIHKYFEEDEKRIIDATVNYTQNLGHKYHVGYSLTWLADLQIVRRDGDKAYDLLNKFWKYFCSVNSFHLNGDYTKQGISSLNYRPFTLEGNFCALDAAQESLLYSEDGYFVLFPAVPKEWKDVSFSTLRGWGGVLVSAKLKDGEVCNAKFSATNDVQFELELDLSKYKISKPDAVLLKGKICVITLQKGETIVLDKLN